MGGTDSTHVVTYVRIQHPDMLVYASNNIFATSRLLVMLAALLLDTDT